MKGLSPLKSYVHLVHGVPSDYMHCVLEGAANWLLKAWFEPRFHSQPFSVRRSLNSVDRMFMNQRPPHEFSRPPRSIKSHLAYWKASEFRSWILFYSLPLLHVLPPLYFHHFALLVCAIHILLQKQLSQIQCHAAEEMLIDFHHLFPELDCLVVQ